MIEGFTGAEREWDLAIVDEAHGFTLEIDGKGLIKRRSERYKAAEAVARKAHRLILLTATPHSGRNESMWGLLRLLDPDAYGDRCPQGDVPLNAHQYRKVAKEEMVDMRGEALFKPRHPHTVAYDLEGAEQRLYEAVTGFVSTELARIRGESGPRVAGFALTTMQRRLASSLRAIKRTLERRVNRLEQALEDPATYLRGRREFISDVYGEQHPDELVDLNEDERWDMEEKALEEWLPGTTTELEEELTALRGDQADPKTEARFRELTKEALATRYLDWQSQAEATARAAERRLPPGYIEKFFTDAVDFLGGKVEDRLDPGTLRVARTPDELVAGSRAAGATREVFPTYERITFDKAVRLRAHTGGGEHAAPEAELCGPGHPLFDAALDTVIVRTRADVEAGAVFAAPDVDAPTVLFFLTGDCVDGSAEIVHRAFATVAEPEGEALQPSRMLLYDLFPSGPGAPQVIPADGDRVVSWARQHEFEAHFRQASGERTRVVHITEDYLTKVSFPPLVCRWW